MLAAFRVSFGTSLAAGSISVVAGMLVAWVLVRYEFPGKKLVDALVDLPFALPTAVAGIALTSLYTENGWIGRAILCAPWNQDRVHAAWDRHCTYVHRSAVRRS